MVALAPVWSEVDSVPEIEEERTNKGYRDLCLLLRRDAHTLARNWPSPRNCSVGWPEANESRHKKYRLNETAYIVESDRKQRASGHIVNGCRLAIQPIAYSKNMPCVLRCSSTSETKSISSPRATYRSRNDHSEDDDEKRH